MEADDQKILFWGWVVKEEFAFPGWNILLARIDLHLNSAIPAKVCHSRKN